jgi:hypothetical protein
MASHKRTLALVAVKIGLWPSVVFLILFIYEPLKHSRILQLVYLLYLCLSQNVMNKQILGNYNGHELCSS